MYVSESCKEWAYVNPLTKLDTYTYVCRFVAAFIDGIEHKNIEVEQIQLY